jgi:hypothetical protein
MAIDTSQKRAAVPGVARPFMRSIVPTLVKDAAWRYSVGLSYPPSGMVVVPSGFVGVTAGGQDRLVTASGGSPLVAASGAVDPVISAGAVETLTAVGQPRSVTAAGA